MEWVVSWILFAFVPGLPAHWKGRDATRWFFLALLISPLIAFIILLIAPDLKKEREKVEAAAQRMWRRGYPVGPARARARQHQSDRRHLRARPAGAP